MLRRNIQDNKIKPVMRFHLLHMSLVTLKNTIGKSEVMFNIRYIPNTTNLLHPPRYYEPNAKRKGG